MGRAVNAQSVSKMLSSQIALNERIYKTFAANSTMQIAYKTIMNDLLKGDLHWTELHENIVVSYKHRIRAAEQHWNHFIHAVVLSLCLYGYVLVRRGPYNRHTKQHMPEVASGRDVVLYFDNELQQWVPRATEFGKKLRKSKEWSLIMLESPILNSSQSFLPRVLGSDFKYGSSNDEVVPMSAGARAMVLAERSELFLLNVLRRDELNSQPNVFTSVSKNFVNQQGQTRPWFHAMQQNMAPDPLPPQDFDTLVQQRTESIQQLDKLSEQIRMQTQMQYQETNGTTPMGTKEEQRISRESLKHREFFISDGRDGTVVPHIHGSEDFREVYKEMQHQILFIWQVPPQVLGQNINSERLASSNTLVERALAHYEAHIRNIRALVDQALVITSTDIRTQRRVCLFPCISMRILSKVEAIVTPQEARRMYSCCYDVPEDAFDMDAIKTHQQALLAGDAKTSKNRPLESEDTKEKRRFNKATTGP